MSDAKHTPTPWSVEVEVDYEDEQPHVYVCSSATQCDLTVVATMGEAISIPLDRKKDDAYLIVTAVNSYASSQAEIARLREAADAALHFITNIDNAHPSVRLLRAALSVQP